MHRLSALGGLIWCALLYIASGATGVPKYNHFYNESALQFLKTFGHHYRLFDRFFGYHNETLLQVKNPGAKLFDSGDIADISELFLTKDYNMHHTWGATADVVPELLHYTACYENQTDSYLDSPMYREMYHLDANSSDRAWMHIDFEANNKFRYGKEYHERFLSIFFHKDPWQHDDATVNFVGMNTQLDPTADRFICEFKYPDQGETAVTVVGDLRNAVNVPTGDNIIYCDIPASIKAKLQSAGDAIDHVSLNLIRVGPSGGLTGGVSLLSNIRIPRTKPIDRRHQRVAMVTNVDDYNDPMIVEWMIFHILQGVDHFYLFNNKKTIDPDFYSQATNIKPFLDANVLTLVSFPFYHDIQSAIYQVFLQQYGYLYQWFGTNDVDEFFFPRPESLTLNGCAVKDATDGASNDPNSANLIESFMNSLGGTDERVPGVMFDTQEMGCHDKSNHFKSKAPHALRKAVSTHCTIAGKPFLEMKEGHGKMFLRPDKIPYLPSPHRLNHYWVVWTTPQAAGNFRHFDNFRYTKMDPSFKEHHYNYQDTSLRHFTMNLLRTCHGFDFLLDMPVDGAGDAIVGANGTALGVSHRTRFRRHR